MIPLFAYSPPADARCFVAARRRYGRVASNRDIYVDAVGTAANARAVFCPRRRHPAPRDRDVGVAGVLLRIVAAADSRAAAVVAARCFNLAACDF